MRLERAFYERGAVEVARDLVGKILVHETEAGVASGRILETEAYAGVEDRASHAHRGGRDGRARVWYGPGGYAYMYLIYGLHVCANIVVCAPGQPQAVLLRALTPLAGLELMKKRRNRADHLCDGPGRLAQAMGLTLAHYGADFCSETLFVEDDGTKPGIVATPRVGVAYAGEDAARLWRFVAAK